MNEIKVTGIGDEKLLQKIRDEYIKPNAPCGTNAYLCAYLSRLPKRIEKLEADKAVLLDAAKEVYEKHWDIHDTSAGDKLWMAIKAAEEVQDA